MPRLRDRVGPAPRSGRWITTHVADFGCANRDPRRGAGARHVSLEIPRGSAWTNRDGARQPTSTTRAESFAAQEESGSPSRTGLRTRRGETLPDRDGPGVLQTALNPDIHPRGPCGHPDRSVWVPPSGPAPSVARDHLLPWGGPRARSPSAKERGQGRLRLEHQRERVAELRVAQPVAGPALEVHHSARDQLGVHARGDEGVEVGQPRRRAGCAGAARA
jgi:hypothetical protein